MAKKNSNLLSGLEPLSASTKPAWCLAFAKCCLNNEQTLHVFLLNPDYAHTIKNRKIYCHFVHNDNYKNSAMPYCQRLLNIDHQAYFA